MCFHNWSRWGKAFGAYDHITQHKVCVKCGTIKWRKIGLSSDCGNQAVVNEGVSSASKAGE